MKKLLLSLICLLALGLPALADSVTITMESQGWSDQQDLASETIETDNFTISFAKNDATNPTKYFSSDKTVRLYKASSGKSNGGSFEIIPKDGIVLSSAVYKNTEEGNDNTISINNGIARYCNTTTSTVKIYSLTVTYSSAAGPSYPTKCDYPTFNYSDGEEVAAGSTIKATCATTGSTVTLTTPTGIITGEDGNGFAEYTIPESLVGTIAVIKATATVQGESEVLSAESTIDIDVIKAPETISDELTAKTFNLSSNTYTIYKSALENTGITYYAKASLNNNRMQINTSASTGGKNSGIISTDNQPGWIIDKIEVNGEIASDKLIIKVAHNPGTLTGKVGDTGKECGIAPNSDAVSVSATSFTTVDSEGNLYTDLKKEIFIYVDENLDPQPTKATSTVTFDFVKNNHLCTEDDYTNDLNSYFYIRSRELGLIEAYIALEQNQTGSFNYTDNQGWNFNINGEDETKFQFVFYPNSEFESYGYKLTGIKIEGDFDDKFVVFNDYITSSELTNSMWNGLEDIVMLEAVAFENFTISAIDVTFEHDIVKMPELFGQDGKLGLSHSDGHEIYYKVVAENSQMRTVNRDPAYDDNFQLYTEPFTLRDGETIYAYAQHPHGMVSEILAKTYADIATGVEGIASDDAEGDVRYFNLQGVKVENPAEGIYIRVANGKAEKIIK